MSKSSLTEVKDDVDVLLVEYTKSLQLDDDFVWIENTPSAVLPREDQDHLDSTREINTYITNIAQHDTNTETSDTAKERRQNCTENVIGAPTEWEKEVLQDLQYWEQNGAVVKRVISPRIKYPASQRLTVTELNKIAMSKTASKDPSYYKFDISTTALLNDLIDKKILKSYHNVIGRGSSSVVIQALKPGPEYDVRERAVKVYKLSHDVKKNKAALKRCQREYEHLRIVGCRRVPGVYHQQKNVIILTIPVTLTARKIGYGYDHEPCPDLSTLPSEYCEDVYQLLVEELKEWYTKYSIVHGKLCTKNILYEIRTSIRFSRYCERGVPCWPHIIGWGHSVKRDHPRALKKLMRDCHFVTNFFKSRDIPVKTTTELFKEVTELEEVSSELLDAVYKRDLWKEGLLTNPNKP